jgi:hypothetical protein
MKEEEALEGSGSAMEAPPNRSPDAEASGVPENQPSRRPGAAGRGWSRLVKLDVLLASGLLLFGVAMAAPYFFGRIRRGDASDKKPYTVEQVGAMHLRMQAADACEKSQWSLCLAKLDDAKRLDPKGDEEEYVKSARRVADQMLLQSDASAGDKAN